jgi:phasin family protein
VQDLGKSLAATAQAQLDQTVTMWKALAGVKSPTEAIALQSSLARKSVEQAVSETSKLTDASLKLVEQTWAPITARMTLALDKFAKRD